MDVVVLAAVTPDNSSCNYSSPLCSKASIITLYCSAEAEMKLPDCFYRRCLLCVYGLVRSEPRRKAADNVFVPVKCIKAKAASVNSSVCLR